MSGSGNGSPADEGSTEETGLSPVDSPGGGGSAEGAAPASPADGEVATLRQKVEALVAERNELKDQLLRRRADFENYRKRSDRERQQAAFEAVAAVFRELVPVLDNLERALVSGADEDALRTGVQLIHRELLSFLDTNGVVVQDPAGQVFDPEKHQALLHEVVPGTADGTVVETFRKGYYFKERLLRPALVKVAKDAAPDETATADDVH